MSGQVRALGAAPYLVVGMASAIAGLLPWLITGMRLPLQNLWATETLPEQMPITMLPFSQYALALLAAVIVVGAAIAGCFARATRAHSPRFALLAMIVGVVAVQATATIQTAVTVSNGLRDSGAAQIYLAGLVGGTVAAILIGLLVLLLIARAPAPGVVIGVSVAGIAVSSWLSGLVLPFGSFPNEVVVVLLSGMRWVPAIIVGLTVVWSGLGTIGRVVAALGGLLLIWIVPAAIHAVSVAAGARVFAHDPAEMADYAKQMFVLALGPAGGALVPLLVAVIVMVLGLAVKRLVRARRA